MTEKDLKKLFGEIAAEYGFKKHRYMFIKEYEKFILRISLQNYLENDEYHFNCYFLIKDMNSSALLSSFLTADITGREKFVTDKCEVETISLKDYSKEEISNILRNSIDKFMRIIETTGLGGYLKKNPEIIPTIPIRSKEYLEKEGVI